VRRRGKIHRAIDTIVKVSAVIMMVIIAINLQLADEHYFNDKMTEAESLHKYVKDVWRFMLFAVVVLWSEIQNLIDDRLDPAND
jgi:hypothetical protein